MSYWLSASELEMLEGEYAQTFTWSGESFPCIYGARTESKDLDFGGFSLDADITIVARVEVFGAALPAVKDEVTCDGRALRIARIIHSPENTFIQLLCNDDTRGV